MNPFLYPRLLDLLLSSKPLFPFPPEILHMNALINLPVNEYLYTQLSVLLSCFTMHLRDLSTSANIKSPQCFK